MEDQRARKMVMRNRRGIDQSMNQFISKMKDMIGDFEHGTKGREPEFGGKMIMRSSRRERGDPKGSRVVEYYQEGYEGNSISGRDTRKSRRSRDVVSSRKQILDNELIENFERSLGKRRFLWRVNVGYDILFINKRNLESI